MRVSGLTSGIDIESLIQQLVQLKSQPISRYQEEQDTINDKKNAWNDIESKISDLNSAISTLEQTSLWDTLAATFTTEGVVSATVSSSASKGVYDITVTTLAKAESDASADAATLGVTDADSDLIAAGIINAVGDTFDINGVTVTLTDAGGGTVTLRSIANDINNTAGVGVTASIVADTLVITANDTGTANAITFANDVNLDLENLQVIVGGGDYSPANQLQAAQDAQFSVNGLSVTRSSNENITDVITGVTLNLLDTGSTTMTIDTDMDTIKSDINDFVEKFNTVLTTISSYIGEDGVLQGDLLADSIASEIRERAMDYVSGLTDYNLLDKVGITISDSTMIFDETKFDQAWADNSPEVVSLFTNTSATYQEKGVMVKLDEYIQSLTETDGTFDTKIETLDDLYDEYQDRIESYQAYLDNYAEILRKKFQAMEEALASLQQQGSYLASLIAQMGGASLF